MSLNFPNNPTVNQTYAEAGKVWIFNGSRWTLLSPAAATFTIADGSITTAKLADSAVTAAKIADGTVVAGEIASNAITQAKLATSLSAVTITTSANRDAAVPSPFTGQLVFLTDTKKVQVWDGSLWLNITLAPPEPPTSLSATALSTTSISVSFTAGGANGSPITNYKYALSTNGGSSYGAFTALDPADATSPITISGLTAGTTYHIKLKAVNDMGDSVESSATSVSTLATPDAPTGLSASNITTTTVTISFTAGSDNGYAITNYQYALSTNGGSSYGSFTALDPADGTSPITITGLTTNTAYYIKLKAVNSGGAGAESAAVSFTTLIPVDYLVVAGGGGAAGWDGVGSYGGGAGAGGLRSTVTSTGGGGALESPIAIVLGTNYTVTVGAGGASGSGSANGSKGQNSVFSTITSEGGGFGPAHANNAGSGGSGGGPGGGGGYKGTGTANQGFDGGPSGSPGSGGGAGAAGTNSPGTGGVGVAVEITGSSVFYAGGGARSPGSYPGYSTLAGGNGGGGLGVSPGAGGGGGTNLGGGGGGGGQASTSGGAGGSGVVILRYSSALTITVGAGLTTSHVNETIAGGYKYTRITAGSGNVSWS